MNRPQSTRVVAGSQKSLPQLFNPLDGAFYKKFMSEKLAAIWTVNDQKRLVALSSLYNRMLEFHNNIHTRDLPIQKNYRDDVAEDSIDATSPVAQILHFARNQFEQTYTVSHPQFTEFCQTLSTTRKQLNSTNIPSEEKAPHKHDFTWIHLKDISALDILANELNMHELIIAGFHDLRAHSSITPANSELLITFITFAMEDNDCNMYKLYIYMSHDLVVTFFTELLPDLTEEAPQEVSNLSMQESSVHSNSNNKSLDGDSIRSTTTNFIPASIHNLFGPFLEHPQKIRKQCLELGSVYLVYILILQSIKIFDSSLEFISYALSYFNHIVHLNLLHRERLELMIKLHMLTSGIQLMKQYMEGSANNCMILTSSFMDNMNNSNGHSNSKKEQKRSQPMQSSDTDTDTAVGSNNRDKFNTLVQGRRQDTISITQEALYTTATTSSSSSSNTNNNSNNTTHLKITSIGLNKLIYPSLIDVMHIPYLFDLSDNFVFVNHCLQRELDESHRLKIALDGTITLRTSNTNIVLSLIATIFLPLTFLAGVFGMNFQEDGGFSIGLLNQDYGPTVFYSMCTFSFLITFTFFVFQGWIEFGIFGEIFQFFHATKDHKIDDSKKKTSQRALVRAEKEETRRRAISNVRRSLSNVPRFTRNSITPIATTLQQQRKSSASFSHSKPIAANNNTDSDNVIDNPMLSRSAPY